VVEGLDRLGGLRLECASGFRAWVRLWGGVGGGGSVIVAEFGVKCLHFLHADVVGCA